MKYIFNSPCSPCNLVCSSGSYLISNGEEVFNQELLRKYPQLFRKIEDDIQINNTVNTQIEEVLEPIEIVKRGKGRPAGAKNKK